MANETTHTICDGLRAQIGEINFPIIHELVDGVITLTELEIIDSMRMIWEQMKIIVEPSSSIALAAIIKNKDIFHIFSVHRPLSFQEYMDYSYNL